MRRGKVEKSSAATMSFMVVECLKDFDGKDASRIYSRVKISERVRQAVASDNFELVPENIRLRQTNYFPEDGVKHDF